MRTRRAILTATAAIPLAACGITINPTTGQVTLPLNVVDFITNAVAIAAKYVPTAESIALAAAQLFGPAYVSIVTIGSAAINQLIAYLTNLVTPPANPPAAARKMGALLKAAAPGSHLIGYATGGIPIYGYN